MLRAPVGLSLGDLDTSAEGACRPVAVLGEGLLWGNLAPTTKAASRPSVRGSQLSLLSVNCDGRKR